MGKRTAVAASGAGSAAKKQKNGPVSSKCDEVVAALKGLPDMTVDVREMLTVALPLAMVPEPERHGLQEGLITAVAGQMARVEAGLQTSLQQAEAQVKTVAEEKEQCVTAAAAAEAALKEKMATAQEKKKALAKDAGDVRAAKAALAEAEAEAGACEDKIGAAEHDLGELKTSVEESLEPLKEGAFVQELATAKASALVGKLQRLVHMEESLFTVAPAALAKAPSARGPFELMVVGELSEQCTKRLAALQKQVADAGPAKAAAKAATDAAQAKLAEARGRQRASAEAFAAARTEQERKEADHGAATKASKAAGPRLRGAEKALQDVLGRLEGFRAGPAVAFAELRTRTAPAAPAEGEPPAAAAPNASSCASEVAAGLAVGAAAEVAAAA